MTNRIQLLSSRRGFQTWIEDNPHDEENPIVHERQNLAPVLEAVRIQREFTPGKEWRHAAYIPAFVWNQAVREGWVNDQKKWRAWANSSDNSAFRTWPGRL